MRVRGESSALEAVSVGSSAQQNLPGRAAALAGWPQTVFDAAFQHLVASKGLSSTGIGGCRVDSAPEVLHAAVVRSSGESAFSTAFLAGQPSDRRAPVGEVSVPRSPPPTNAHRSQRTRSPRRLAMTRMTPQALLTDSPNAGSEPENTKRGCGSEVHRLPFNTDSPTWLQDAPDRPAAEERMSRLVRTLEAEVIPRLVEAHRTMPMSEVLTAAAPCPPPTVAEVEVFVQLVLRREDRLISECIDSLRDKGMPIEVIFLQLLAPAAGHLGHLWSEDLCDFTDVTLAMGRLQQLLQKLSPEFGTSVEFPTNARKGAAGPGPRGASHFRPVDGRRVFHACRLGGRQRSGNSTR